MLSPLNFECDCHEIVSTLVDHKILVGWQRDNGLEKARILWTKAYPGEPCEVELNNPDFDVPSFESKIHYDIAQACSRQRVFYYQVSLPHYGDEKFFKNAVERYISTTSCFNRNTQRIFLFPCYDFDLIWHAHQVQPIIYRNDTLRILGKVLNHNDSVNDRRLGSKLTVSHHQTREKWSLSGEKFELNGAMFRGEPPRQLHFVSVDYSSLASNQYTVQLVSLEVQGLPESKSYTIQMDVANGERVINKSAKGPAADVRVSSKFTLSTSKSRALKVGSISINNLNCNQLMIISESCFHFPIAF